MDGDILTKNRSIRTIAGAAALLASIFALTPSAHAQTREFGRPGNFKILTEPQAPGSCRAIMYERKHQPTFGELFAIAYDGRNWQIWTDYRIYEVQSTPVLVDGRPFNVRFEQIENVAVAPAGRELIAAIGSGGHINLNLDPEGPDYSLRGSAGAIELLEACAGGGGKPGIAEVQPGPGAGPREKNDYGGYDVAGQPQGEYSYSRSRGWQVFAARSGSSFAYCVAETRRSDGSAIRIGWDGMEWQLAVPVDSRPGWEGTLQIDGAGSGHGYRSGGDFISGIARAGWTIAWLGQVELDGIRRGRVAVLGVGKFDYDFSLSGARAASLKVQECVERSGRTAQALPPQPRSLADAALHFGMASTPMVNDPKPTIEIDRHDT